MYRSVDVVGRFGACAWDVSTQLGSTLLPSPSCQVLQNVKFAVGSVSEKYRRKRKWRPFDEGNLLYLIRGFTRFPLPAYTPYTLG